MNIRLRLGLIGLGALVVIAVFTFPLWRPLLVDDVVDEAFPGLPAEMQDDFRALPQEEQDMLMEMRDENEAMALDTARALLSADTNVVEDMPPMNDLVTVTQGTFIRLDALHGAEGTVTIYRLPDQTLVARFEDFRSTNGPELHVLLSKHADPRDSADLGDDYRDLGLLKGNVGNQNYPIPADVNIVEFNSIVIYCLPFQVVFSTATLP